MFTSYNLPGGALGSLTSQTFDLSNYTAVDKPTLYFDYALDDAGSNALDGSMQDSFRVYASSDGVNWTELVTNNSVKSNVFQANAELPTYSSVNGGAYENDKSNQQVQEAFDVTGNPSVGPADPNTTAVGWRQARVDLGDFAGKSNVRLRFDFSTAGSMGIGSIDQGGVYLGALAGNQLQDGQGYILDNTKLTGNNPDGSPIFTTLNYSFTFRQGFVLQVPAGGGPSIAGGETFTVNGVTFELTKTGTVTGGNVAILIADTMSSSQVATAISSIVGATPAALVTPHVSGDRVQLVGATSVTQSAGHKLVLQGAAVPVQPPLSTASTGIDIPYYIDDSVATVSLKMASAMDRLFAAVDGNTLDATMEANNAYVSSKVMWTASADGNSQVPSGVLRLYNHNGVNTLSVGSSKYIGTAGPSGNNVGQPYTPLPFSGTLKGDSTGLFASPVTTTYHPIEDQFGFPYFYTINTFNDLNKSLNRTMDNTHEGVYIDNIVVGMAGRGEMVTGNYSENDLIAAVQNTSGGAVPITGDVTFFAVPSDPDYTDPKHVTTGAFQLDIRQATQYASYAGGGSTPFILLDQSFDINDRLAQAFTLVALPANQIIAGLTASALNQTFSIDTEIGVFTFEFVTSGSQGAKLSDGNYAVVIHQNDSATTVAAEISAAINAVPTTAKFGVKALTLSKSDRVNLFGAAAEINPGPLGLITFNNIGDATPVRLQGYTVISNNKISNSLTAGIAAIPQNHVDDQGNTIVGVPGHTGSVTNAATLNTPKLVPGISFSNNLIVNPGQYGIVFSGSGTSDISYAVPFGRIFNNTIVGAPIGIDVINNASPTILNNIITSATTAAIMISSSSATSVVGETVYQNDTAKLVGLSNENNPIYLQPTSPLFVDAAHGNYYLQSGSQAIDSSINTLPERSARHGGGIAAGHRQFADPGPGV